MYLGAQELEKELKLAKAGKPGKDGKVRGRGWGRGGLSSCPVVAGAAARAAAGDTPRVPAAALTILL